MQKILFNISVADQRLSDLKEWIKSHLIIKAYTLLIIVHNYSISKIYIVLRKKNLPAPSTQ